VISEKLLEFGLFQLEDARYLHLGTRSRIVTLARGLSLLLSLWACSVPLRPGDGGFGHQSCSGRVD
jgi:hypothetical protein